ncbi:MAG: CaiB/BaiF CoA transferase family protein [Acidimicrobiales bacterium]
MTGDPTVGRPLEGLRVIDVGTRISAPFCAGLLGELGAEVIKVEDPKTGDFMRHIGPFVPNDEGRDYSLFWAVEGRGRQSVTCDLRTPTGQDLFRKLAATADVVCENFRPGTMERWHIGPDDCSPELVWVRVSIFGQDGPNADRPGLDRLGIGYGGLLHLTGEPDRPPVRPGVTISDYLTGVFGAMAAIAGLYRRDVGRDGQAGGDGQAGRGGTRPGAVVDAALYGSILRVLEWTIAGYDQLGVVRGRQGNRLDNSAPLDNYPTADGRYVCIVAGSDANFGRLCTAMDRPDLAADPAWSSLAKRAARADEINGIVADWTSSRTAAEVEAACIACDVPVGLAYTAADIAADPHMIFREDLVAIDDPVLGAVQQQAPFPRFQGEERPVPTGAPRLGADNDEVWGSLVGPDEVERLRSDHII